MVQCDGIYGAEDKRVWCAFPRFKHTEFPAHSFITCQIFRGCRCKSGIEITLVPLWKTNIRRYMGENIRLNSRRCKGEYSHKF